jgi:betaine-aldehyde dehydrogenase
MERVLRARRVRLWGWTIHRRIPIISEMPHGGFKQSGYRKDMSQYSLDDYIDAKHVMSDITAQGRKPWRRTIFTESAPRRETEAV